MISRILLSGLIEGALIVAIAACIARVHPRSAATRCSVWVVALAATIAMPVLTIFVVIPRPESALDGYGSFVAIAHAAARGATMTGAPSVPFLGLIWIVGTLLMLARLCVQAIRLRSIRRAAEPLGFARDLLVSDAVTIPLATGVLSPVIILPRKLTLECPFDELMLIVEHERAHIARWDIAINACLRVAQAVLFFNPWIFVIGAAIERDREAACDDVVVARTGEPERYARSLAMLARGAAAAQSLVLTASVFGSRSSLLTRIERLIDARIIRIASPNRVVIGGTIMLFALLALGLDVFSPSVAHGAPITVAAACATPNRPAIPTLVAPADFPESEKMMKKPASATILVSIDAAGRLIHAQVKDSSGVQAFDAAALDAAEKSTYAPALANCRPVAGRYLFRTDFIPATVR